MIGGEYCCDDAVETVEYLPCSSSAAACLRRGVELARGFAFRGLQLQILAPALLGRSVLVIPGTQGARVWRSRWNDR